MKKTRVLIVSDFFYPHWTGIVKSIFNITQSLKNKIDFTVLTVQYQKTLAIQEVSQGIKIIRKPSLYSFSRVKYSLSLIFAFFSLVRQTDVVFINSPCSNILPTSILTKLFRKKLIIFHQGDLVLPRTPINQLIGVIFEVSTLLSFLLADKVSTYTKDYAENSRVLKYFLAKFTPLVPPISVIRLTDEPVSALKTELVNERLEKLKNQNKILFGFGGRFVEEKGFDILFKAIPEVIKKIPDAHFVFAGETNMGYEKTFQNLKFQISNLKSKIIMLGLLDDHELSSFYSLIDFVVIPSRSDCFPLFQAEAMLAGKPSIVADIPGARYLVKQSGFGLVFKKENPGDLAATLIEAVDKKNSLQKKFGHVLAILDNGKNAERFRNYFEK